MILLAPLKQQSTGKHVSPLGHIIMILLKQQSTGKHVLAPLWHIIMILLETTVLQVNMSLALGHIDYDFTSSLKQQSTG